MAGPSVRAVPRPYAFSWGAGSVVEEAAALGQHHDASIQLLEGDDGGLHVRFCYYNLRGQFQRSPLLIGEQDVEALRASLATTPRLRDLLRRLVAD